MANTNIDILRHYFKLGLKAVHKEFEKWNEMKQYLTITDLWCNGYHRRKWTQRHKFKSWTRLIAFHIALIPLRKV